MSRNKVKVTHKQIEYHLNNLYNAVKTESETLTTVMKVITDFIGFSDKTEEFEKFLKEKYPKINKEKDLWIKNSKPKLSIQVFLKFSPKLIAIKSTDSLIWVPNDIWNKRATKFIIIKYLIKFISENLEI